MSWSLRAYNLVLDAFGILEKDRVVTRRRVFRVLPRRADDGGADRPQRNMEPVYLVTRRRFERKMMERPWFPAIHLLGRERSPRRGDGEPQSRVFVRHDVLLVIVDHGLAPVREIKSQQRQKPVV